MLLAGICFGLTIGSRPSQLAIVLGPLGLLAALAWFERQDTKRWRPSRAWWITGLAFGTGTAGVLLLLLAYNYARFDHPLEFGLTYQLTDPPHFKQASLSAGF